MKQLEEGWQNNLDYLTTLISIDEQHEDTSMKTSDIIRSRQVLRRSGYST